MSQHPFNPYAEPPTEIRWRYLIVSGILGVIVAAFAVLLIWQASDWINQTLVNALFPSPTAPPPPTLSDPTQAVLGLYIPIEGKWQTEHWLYSPVWGWVYLVENGEGSALDWKLAFPAPLAYHHTEFQVWLTLPNPDFKTGKPLLYATYATYADYLSALDQLYIATYNAQNELLAVGQVGEISIAGLHVEEWQP